MSIYLLVIIYKEIFEFLYNVHIYICSHYVIIKTTNENDTTRRNTQNSHCFLKTRVRTITHQRRYDYEL